jgi:glycogen(starch) synthase
MTGSFLNIGYIMQANAVDMSIVSGPQLHVEAVVKGLDKRGHNVRMVAIQKGNTLWTDDLLDWHRAEFGFSESKSFHVVESVVRGLQSRLRFPFFRLFDSYRFSDACVSAFTGFDILYERDSTISYGGLMAARRMGIPLVLEVNGDLIEEWEHLGLHFSKGQRAIVHLITRQLYRRASHIVTVGETIRRHLIRRWGLNPKQVSVVTNGADVELFHRINGAERVKKRYSLGLGPVIIFVGGFQPWHGVELILDGFAKIVTTKLDAKMVFVGDGPLYADLQGQVQARRLSTSVILTGRLEHNEVVKLINIADIAVIYHRGSAAEIVETPLKLFEYMAAGKAILAPAVPNMERILTDRVNALLVPPEDPAALAHAMVELLENRHLRISLGECAKKEAIEKHSWDRAVCELESILFRVLSKSGRGNLSESRGVRV